VYGVAELAEEKLLGGEDGRAAGAAHQLRQLLGARRWEVVIGRDEVLRGLMGGGVNA
jgi:hypothetical protein